MGLTGPALSSRASHWPGEAETCGAGASDRSGFITPDSELERKDLVRRFLRPTSGPSAGRSRGVPAESPNTGKKRIHVDRLSNEVGDVRRSVDEAEPRQKNDRRP